MGANRMADGGPWAIFLIFLRLGLTSFGGPIAHLGYMREEFVVRRGWQSEQRFADLVALCQFLPGPASSQVGLSLGLFRGGLWGAVAAWAGFTLPSAIALILFALGLTRYGDVLPLGVLHGLKCVAVAVVAQAVWGMSQKLCTDGPRVTIMAVSCCVALMVPTALGQVGVILLAALVGIALFRPTDVMEQVSSVLPVRRRTGVIFLTVFFLLLLSLPLLGGLSGYPLLARGDAFFRAGALVFGGGHVVLPLLEASFVTNGWVDQETFLAGYGAAQAVPGPLFTFGAFLGASMGGVPTGIVGGLFGVVAIFLPSFLLIVGVLPFWDDLRRSRRMQTALIGINAAVVGLLLAALYSPVWTSAIHQPQDFGLALLALVALMYWRVSAWLVVLGSGVAGGVLGSAMLGQMAQL